jgi:hypothetical protein
MASHDAGEIGLGFLASGSDDRRLHLLITKTWAEGLSTSRLLGSELLSDKIERKCLSIECVRIA